MSDCDTDADVLEVSNFNVSNENENAPTDENVLNKTSGSSSSISSFFNAPMSSTPKSKEPEGKRIKRKRSYSGENKMMGNFIQTTTPEQIEMMKTKWAAFF